MMAIIRNPDPVSGILSIYTIYNNPSNYPGYYVISKWDVEKGSETKDTTYHFKSTNLQECRDQLKSLYCVGREPDDDPVILESYI